MAKEESLRYISVSLVPCLIARLTCSLYQEISRAVLRHKGPLRNSRRFPFLHWCEYDDLCRPCLLHVHPSGRDYVSTLPRGPLTAPRLVFIPQICRLRSVIFPLPRSILASSIGIILYFSIHIPFRSGPALRTPVQTVPLGLTRRGSFREHLWCISYFNFYLSSWRTTRRTPTRLRPSGS